tara:strand:- start:7652 stop:13846 length:6195 start_codon:yes stop_codon:yes gene_type:complete
MSRRQIKPRSTRAARATGDKNLDRVVKEIYGEINQLIDSVNTPYYKSELSTRDGKPGDIRIVQNKGFGLSRNPEQSAYYIEGKTDDGWVRQYMQKVEHSGVSRDGTIPYNALTIDCKRQIKQGILSFWKSDGATTLSLKNNESLSSDLYTNENVVVGKDVAKTLGIGDTVVARVSTGELSIQGNRIYRAGCADIPTSDTAAKVESVEVSGTGLSKNAGTGAVTITVNPETLAGAIPADTITTSQLDVTADIVTLLDNADMAAVKSDLAIAHGEVSGLGDLAVLDTIDHTKISDFDSEVDGKVTTGVNNLIDAAPGALNTLNELAAALGDDEDFSTTITNSLALKAPLASPTFTGTIAIPNIANLETEVTSKATAAEAHAYVEANALSLTADLTTNSLIDGVDIATRDGVLTTTTTTANAAMPKSGGAFTGAVTTNSTIDGVDIATRDGVLTTTTATADAALPKSGGAMTGPITTNSTFDGVDIATRDGVLTTTTTTANAALPKAGGEMTGNITFSGSQTIDGRDISADGTKLDATETTANAALPKANVSGSGVNVVNSKYSSFREPALPTTVKSSNITRTLDTTAGDFVIGNASIKMVASGSDGWLYFGSSTTDYNINIAPNKKWIVSAYVQASAATKAWQIYIKTSDASTSAISGNTSGSADTWTRVSGVIDLSSNSSTSAVMRVDNDGGSGVTMWFDGLMLEEQIGTGTTPSTYVEPAGVLSNELDANKITSGTIDNARISLDAAEIPTITASKISDFDTEVSNNTSVAANTAKTSFPGFGSSGGSALEGDTVATDIGGISASSTHTLTNKTFDANGTGNSLSNVDMANDVTGTLPAGNGGTGLTDISTLLNSNTSKTDVGLGSVDNTQQMPKAGGTMTGALTIHTSTDAPLTLKTSDDDWGYIQFQQNDGQRNAWMGLIADQSEFRISVENDASKIDLNGPVDTLALTSTTGTFTSDTVKIGTGGTGLTLKNNSGALQLRNEADSADITLATTYTAAKCTDANADQTSANSAASITGITNSNIVQLTDSQTLTNKAIDSDNNTITNIVNADIKSGAAIATSKLSGAVTSIASHGLAASATTDTTNADNIDSGTLADARIPNLATSKITSGTFDNARIAAGNVTQHVTKSLIDGLDITEVGTIDSGVWNGTAVANAYVADLPTSKITSGTFADARISSGSVTQHITKTYVDGLDITELGTVDSGVWNGTAVANAYVADLPTSKITSGTFADGRIASASTWNTVTSKTTFFNQAGIPTSLAAGDMWIDSDDGDKLYIAEAAGADQITAGEWVKYIGTKVPDSAVFTDTNTQLDKAGVEALGIQTVGTITSGTWNATAIGTSKGGTGQDLSSSTGILRVNSGTASADATTAHLTEGSNLYYTDARVATKVGNMVDDSSIEDNSGTLRVKASGITNAMLNGSIANAKLANDSISLGGVSIDLGGTDATPAFDLQDSTNTNLDSIKTGSQIAAANISDVEAFSQSGNYSGLRAQSTTKDDVGLGDVLNQAQVKVFRQDGIPTALAAGDLWFDTNDDNKLYVATAAGDDEIGSGEWILYKTYAAKTDALATARNIGGVSFDGTGNINLPGVNIAGDQNTSGNADSATLAAKATALNTTSNGFVKTTSSNGTLSVGALSSGDIPDNAADTSGLAGSATILESTRSIYGNNFNGSAAVAGDITVGGGSGSGTVKSNGDYDLVLQTGNSTTGNITIVDGASGDIQLNANGSGKIACDGNLDLTLGSMYKIDGADLDKGDIGLGNVVNESPSTLKTTMALNNVTNESKATMFTTPTLTGDVTIDGGDLYGRPDAGLTIHVDTNFDVKLDADNDGDNQYFRVLNSGDTVVTSVAEDGTLNLTAPDKTAATTTDNVINITQTLNDSSFDAGAVQVYSAIKANITATDITGWNNTYFMNLQKGGTNKFNIDLDGKVTAVGGYDHFMDTKIHQFYSADANQDYMPFGASQVESNSTADSVNDDTLFIAPYAGTLEKLVIQAATGVSSAPGNTRIALRVNGTTQTFVQETLANETTATFTWTANNTFSAGDRLRLSIDPANTLKYVTATSVWKYTL